MLNNTSSSAQNPFSAHQYLLYERFQQLIEEVHPAMRSDVLQVFQEPGKLFFQSDAAHGAKPAGSWPLLVLLIAESVNPTVSPLYASTVAIAVESFICALDLLDDVEDDDQTIILHKLGTARALNISTLLLGLAQHAIVSLSSEHSFSSFALRMLEALSQTILTATAGQHRDLLAEHRSAHTMTQEECVEIAADKAGALMRLACLLGALCAKADEQTCELVSELGRLSGIAYQLDNDSHDLYYLLGDQESASPDGDAMTGMKNVKTDIVRNKKTLPVVIAARRQADIQDASSLSAEEQKDLSLRTLHEGIIATWGISLLYRSRAREYLQQLEAQHSVSPLLYILLGLR